jgi:hypothetical protein
MLFRVAASATWLSFLTIATHASGRFSKHTAQFHFESDISDDQFENHYNEPGEFTGTFNDIVCSFPPRIRTESGRYTACPILFGRRRDMDNGTPETSRKSDGKEIPGYVCGVFLAFDMCNNLFLNQH